MPAAFALSPLIADLLLTTTAVAAVGGTVASARQSRKASRAQRQQNEVQNRIAERQNQQERVKQIRAARIANAQIANQGAAQGLGGDTSAIAGTESSISSQLGTNLNFLQQNSADMAEAVRLGNRAADAAGRAELFGTVANLGMAGVNRFGG